MQDLLKEKNTERKKQENLLNSQKDNFWNTKENYFFFVRFFTYSKGATNVVPFFMPFLSKNYTIHL